MQITRVGESLAVILPAALVESLNLKEGDQVEVDVRASAVVEDSRQYAGTREEALAFFRELAAPDPGKGTLSREEAMRRLHELSRPAPEGFKFDREEANAP